MRLLKLDQVTGNEILAKSILTPDYQELLSEGTQLRLGYLTKLQDLGITEVFVRDNEIEAKPREILKRELNLKCKEKVREIISKHAYNKSGSMQEISEEADNIIMEIFDDDNVIDQVYDIKERSADLYEHCINTCTLATLLSLKLGLDIDTTRDISVGCLLHDIGLRYVTIEYENTEIEYCDKIDIVEEYHKHPVYGYSAVNNETWLSKTSKEIILCHHEKLDGTGYPLKSKQLSQEIEIAAVCDFFDESISGIGYERKKVYEVIEQLKIYKGIKFDSEVIETLLEFVAVYPTGSKVLTNLGDVGIIVCQNKGFPERPVIQLLQDSNGNAIEENELFNLLEHNNVFIEEVYN